MATHSPSIHDAPTLLRTLHTPISTPDRTKKIWDKAQPFVFAIGGHVLLLGLLVVSFLEQPLPAPQAGVDGASAVEASLVSALPQSDPAPAQPKPVQPASAELQPPKPQALPARLPKPDPADQSDARLTPEKITPEKIAAQPVAQESAPHPGQPQADPSAQASHQGSASPQGVTQQESADATDPFAEMRRERAEQERRHQLEAQDISRAVDARTRTAQAAVMGSQAAPVFPQVDKGGPNLRSPDPSAAAEPWNFGNFWTSRDSPPSTYCAIAAFPRGSGDVVSTDWIDCLLDDRAIVPGDPVVDTFTK